MKRTYKSTHTTCTLYIIHRLPHNSPCCTRTGNLSDPVTSQSFQEIQHLHLMNSTLRIFKAAYRSSFAFIRFTSFSPRYIRGMSNKPDEFRRTVFIRWSSTHKMSYLLVIFMPITIIANSGVFTAIPRPAASPFSIKELPIQRGPCHLINSTMRQDRIIFKPHNQSTNSVSSTYPSAITGIC